MRRAVAAADTTGLPVHDQVGHLPAKGLPDHVQASQRSPQRPRLMIYEPTPSAVTKNAPKKIFVLQFHPEV
jgi:hypothetical protein